MFGESDNILMRDRPPKITEHLSKPPRSGSIRHDDHVVRYPNQSPVCLDARPGTHKQFAEAEELFDLAMKGFDVPPLSVQTRHLPFGQRQIVADEGPNSVAVLADKKQDRSDLGQMDQSLGDTESLGLGKPNGFEPQALGQVPDGSFFAVGFHQPILFDRCHEGSSIFHDRMEDGSTGVPGIHQDRQGSLPEGFGRFDKDLDGQLDLAPKFARGTTGFGTISSDRPAKAPRPDLDDRRDRAQSLDQSIGPVMNPDSLDVLALPGTRRIVQNQQGLGFSDLPDHFLLQCLPQSNDLAGRSGHKLVQPVDLPSSIGHGNLSDRAKFDHPEDSYQVNRQQLSLGLAQNGQEMLQIGRNLCRQSFCHGFLPSYACRIRGFGRKPFYFQSVFPRPS
jgi:hypothetical protein